MKKIIFTLAALGVVCTTTFSFCFYNALNQSGSAVEIQKKLMHSAAYILNTGIAIALLMLVPATMTSIKTQKKYWLLLPYLWFISNAFLYGFFQEELFHFRKQTGLWAGEFSLSFLIVLIYALIAFLIYLLNRLILTWITKRNGSK